LLLPLSSQAQSAASGARFVARAADTPRVALLPPSALRVRDHGVWRTWWESRAAAAFWKGDALLARHLSWRRAARGVEWGEILIGGSGEAWRTRLVVVRVDPRVVRLELDTAFTTELRPAWRIDRAPPEAAVAVNAGQFLETLPWGWVVLHGRQFLPPTAGSLSTAVVGDEAGGIRWIHGGDAVDAAAAALARPAGASAGSARVAWAFQSYPTLLRDGEVPAALRGAGGGVDVAHRDARAAIGRLADGRLLLAITRFGGLGGLGGFVPFGLTTPETAAIMGALGARDAVMLDGGISAQLLVRPEGDAVRQWRGLRAVPLALLVLPARDSRLPISGPSRAAP
jgi:Phosphodiester glycosidase